MKDKTPDTSSHDLVRTEEAYKNYRMLVIALFGVILLIMIVLGLVSWRTIETERSYSRWATQSDGQQIRIDTPRFMLARDTPFEIHIVRRSGQWLKEPMEMTLALPEALTVVSPTAQAYLSPTVVVFLPTAAQSQRETLLVIYPNAVGNWENHWQVQSQIKNGAVVPFEIEGEGIWQHTLGALLSPLQNQSGPFFVLLGVLSPFLLFLIARGLDATKGRYEVEKSRLEIVQLQTAFDKQRREHIEKQEQKRKDNKLQVHRLVRDILKTFSVLDIKSARESYSGLAEPDLKNTIDSSELTKLNSLFALARGEWQDIEIDRQEPFWLEAKAGAMIYGATNRPSNPAAFREGLQKLPVEYLPAGLQNAWTTALGANAVQGRDWPILPQRPPEALMALDELKGSLVECLNNLNPFPREYAEDDLEMGLLYHGANGCFAPNHPLYAQLKKGFRHTLVFGNSGVGKTALALALGRYLTDQDVFACYRNDMPQPGEIYGQLTRSLLEFICLNPTWLSRLQDPDRRLVAQLLAQVVGKQVAIARLAKSRQESASWLKNTLSENRELTQKAGETNLRGLEQEVKEQTVDAPWTELYLLEALRQSTHSLGFPRMRCVIDLALPIQTWSSKEIEQKNLDWLTREWLSWYDKTIQPRLHIWENYLLTLILFVPRPTNMDLNGQHLGIAVTELAWDEDTFSHMIGYSSRQMERAFSNLNPLISAFSGAALQDLLGASQNNPRCFIRLWNRILHQFPNREIISAEMVALVATQNPCL